MPEVMVKRKKVRLLDLRDQFHSSVNCMMENIKEI